MTASPTRVRDVLGQLERQGSARIREDMLKRYGIVAPKSYGVPMGVIQRLANSLGRDHDLALALWATGWYEARLLDRTPHAWRKVTQWSGRRDEFVKRAAFALLASLALHDKQTERWVGKDARRELTKGGKAVRRQEAD